MTATRDKNYIKIFILYLLKNIAYPLDFNTINDIIVQDGYVGYFDFASCFAELVDDGHIDEIHGEDGGSTMDDLTYVITAKGRSVAEGLSDEIFEEIRERSLKSAMKLLSFKKRKAELRYNCEDIDESCGGGYRVTCKILEAGNEVYSVTVKVESMKEADYIKENFYDKPEVIFKGSLALLLGEINYIFT